MKMAQHRFNRAFATSLISHLLVIALFTIALNQADLKQDSSGKIEQFEISEHAQSSKTTQKTRKESTVFIPSVSKDPEASSTSRAAQTMESSGNNPGTGGLDGKNSYEAQIRAKIAQQERYPLEARKRHLEDRVEIEFEIGEKGEIVHLSVKNPGKPAILVEAAKSAIKQAAPFPPPPAGISHNFVVPIDFKIKK